MSPGTIKPIANPLFYRIPKERMSGASALRGVRINGMGMASWFRIKVRSGETKSKPNGSIKEERAGTSMGIE